MTDSKPYPKHILAMQEVEGFVAMYDKMVPEFDTYQRAYESTESIYTHHFGQPKYKNFESFYTVLKRFRKIKK